MVALRIGKGEPPESLFVAFADQAGSGTQESPDGCLQVGICAEIEVNAVLSRCGVVDLLEGQDPNRCGDYDEPAIVFLDDLPAKTVCPPMGEW